ncbi:MAG: flagellin [bacterium]
MGSFFRINNNLAATFAQRQLTATSREADVFREQLSSGLRINSAADDAAGLAVSEKMSTQQRGLSQAQRNIQDGISMLQTADGALDKIQDHLQRMRELAVQAANDSLTDADRRLVDQEVDQLIDEIDDMAERAQFNNRPLLVNGFEPEDIVGKLDPSGWPGPPIDASLSNRIFNSSFESWEETWWSTPEEAPSEWYIDTPDVEGEPGAVREQDIVAHGNNSVRVRDPGELDFSVMDVPRFTVEEGDEIQFGFSARLVTDEEDEGNLDTDHPDAYDPSKQLIQAQVVFLDENFDPIDDSAPYVSFNDIGVFEHFGPEDGFRVDAPEDAVEAAIRIYTYDYSAGPEDVNRDIIFDRFHAVKGGHGELNYQTGANRGETVEITNDDLPTITAGTLGIGGLTVRTRRDAQHSIEALTKAISKVSEARATIGAVQNRLEGTHEFSQIQEENTQASESRLRDADVAEATTNLTRNEILIQAGTSVLSQASVHPELALQLL